MPLTAYAPIAHYHKTIALPGVRITMLDPDAKQFLASLRECQGYEIICIARGAGAYFIDLRHGQIGNNQVFVIRPGQKRKMVFDRCEEGYLFSFLPALFEVGEPEPEMVGQTKLLRAFSESGQIILSDEMLEDLREVANSLLKEFRRLHPFQAELLTCYLKIFLVYLTRHLNEHARPVERNRELELVQQFLLLLNQHYRVKKMVAEYANEIFITANYLNEIVKKNTGYPASFHIRQRIVLEAKRMALYSDVTMKKIAYDLGYSDPCHFSKFFQTVTGKNFSTFKKEIRLSFSL